MKKILNYDKTQEEQPLSLKVRLNFEIPKRCLKRLKTVLSIWENQACDIFGQESGFSKRDFQTGACIHVWIFDGVCFVIFFVYFSTNLQSLKIFSWNQFTENSD